MDLELREPQVADFDQCIELLASPWLCDPSQYETLRAMWSDIIESRCGAPAIALAAGTKNVIHFAFIMFVSDRLAEEYHSCRAPLISRRLLAEWTAGARPFLSPEEAALANAGPGLNLVAMHYGGRLDDPRLYTADYESTHRALRGFNVRTCTVEMFTGAPWDDREMGRALGYRILEYPDECVRAAGIPDCDRPFLWAATRQQDSGRFGYAVSQLFDRYSRPQLGLSPLQQRLLTLALDGATDCVLADLVGISESTVKKNFRTVYDKLRDAGILNEATAVTTPSQPRGAEARRHLLNYIRDHPEELRPYRSTLRHLPSCP